MSVPYILSDSSVTVIVNFTPKIIDSAHPNFARVVDMLKRPDTTEQQVIPLLDIPQAIKTFTSGAVYVKNGKLFHNGAEVRTSLGAKILEFVRAGDDELAEPLKLFLENVALNPDPRAQQDLYDWVQASKLPITGDGFILAWKAVRDDYRSIHAPNDARFDHRIGNRVEQPRDECDANPDQTCSQGLHFCAATYLSNYARGGNRIMVVKIHPRDVVAFPRDYGLAKGRACGYDVVGEVPYDKVGDYYPVDRPVYRGFDAPKAEPKPTLSSIALKIGGVYRRRDGKAVVITGIDPTIGISFDHGSAPYFTDTGRKNHKREASNDIIAEIEFPLTAEDFAVGQRWVTRNGRTVTIKRMDGDLINCSHQALYTENGREYRNCVGRKCNADLVFMLDYKKPEPKKELTKALNLKVGDKVKLRDGTTTTISKASGDIVGYVGNRNYCVFLSTGSANHDKVGEERHFEHPYDVVRVLKRAKLKDEGFKAGQTWQTRNGQIVKIVEVSNSDKIWPVRAGNGATYTTGGFYHASEGSALDLVKRIS